MKCKHCGKENKEGSKFCMWCGQVFDEPQSSRKVQPDKISTKQVKSNSAGSSQNQGYQSQTQNVYGNQNQSYQSNGLGTGNASQRQTGYDNRNTMYQQQQPYGYNNVPYGIQPGMNPNMVTQSPPIHTIIPNYNPSMDYTPLSMWGYFGYSIGFAILLLFPIFGWIIIALIAFGAIGNNIHVRNFARSYFCWVIIQLVFILLLTIGGVAIWSSLANSL